MLSLAIAFTFQSLVLFLVIIPNNLAVYGSNDDALIAGFSVDETLGADARNWVFIKGLLSTPTTEFQNTLNNYGAYGLLLAFVIILSTSALFSVTFSIENFTVKSFVSFYMILILIIFSFFALLTPTYTGSAIFSGSVGFGILFLIYKVKVDNAKDLILLSSILISLSYLLRVESFLLTFGFFIFLFLFEWLFFKHKRSNFFFLKTPFLIFILVFFTNLLIDRNNYADNAWKDYMDMNDLRHSIHLRTAEYVLGDYLYEIGWSQSDYEMFRKFSLADSNKLNVDSLDKALEVSEFTRGPGALLSANLKNELIFINYSYAGQHWILLLLLLIFVAFLILVSSRRLVYLLYMGLILMMALGINYIFAVSYHLPDRLTFNLLFLVVVSVMIITVSEVLSIDKIPKFILVNSIVLSLVLLITFSTVLPERIVKKIEENYKLQATYQGQKFDLNLEPDNQIFIGTGSRLLYAGQNPYVKYEPIDKSQKVLLLGWHNLSPIWDKQLKNFGLDSSRFHADLIQDDRIRWIDNSDALELLMGFYSQYSDVAITIEDTGYLGTDFFRVFKISQEK